MYYYHWEPPWMHFGFVLFGSLYIQVIQGFIRVPIKCETKRNQQKRNETKRNQRNESEIKGNQRKQNEIRC